jgi:N-acetylmuramoyl-L-alanine amidase
MKIIFFLLFLSTSLFAAPTRQKQLASLDLPPPISLRKKELIVIDAGHGGKDTGAKSDKNGYVEKERTLKTARIVKNYLEECGYQVKMTRTDDKYIDLERRAEIANDLKATLFVSIHYNYCANPDADGVEIFYYKDEHNPFAGRILASKKLGEEVLKRILKHTGAHGRGVKKANFAVVRETKMPAILIEGGFLSNPEERAKILDEPYLCYMGWAIARGIDSYLQRTKKL